MNATVTYIKSRNVDPAPAQARGLVDLTRLAADQDALAGDILTMAQYQSWTGRAF